MKNHLIKSIHIKDFKCFDDFKAEGFAQVNLIGGKNSVGKTAFMEACLVNVVAQDIKSFSASLIAIKFMREAINNLDSSSEERASLLSFLELSDGVFISTDKNTCSFKVDSLDGIKKYKFKINNNSTIININDFSPESKDSSDVTFIRSSGNPDLSIINTYAFLQRIDKEEYLNRLLKKLNPRIESFKVIRETPKCKVKGKYIDLTEMGDGVRHLVSIVTSLYATENGYLFVDEIENGIHYKVLEDIWNIVLKLSKELNVQVFATTHSKECIESFNRVQLEQEDKSSSYFELAKSISSDKISMSALPPSQLEYELSHKGKFRGE